MRLSLDLVICAAAALLAGTTAASAADIAETAAPCLACHGEGGIPSDPTVPIIDGQAEGYLYLQLRDYKQGARAHEVMGPIASELDKPQMREIAAWFAARPWPRIDHPPPDDAAVVRARNAASSGLCTECHLADLQGDRTVPRLAGQNPAYLKSTMRAFKSKERANNPGMTGLIATYEGADFEAIGSWLSSLRVGP